MYLKFDDSVFDDDLNFLRDLFTLLDTRLDNLQKRIAECHDPDGMGLFDEGEYLAGLGFVASQRYLASTYGQHGLKKDVALAIGPHHEGGESFASIINAVANYWKHVDEWNTMTISDSDADGLSPIVLRDPDRLDSRQKKTVDVIQSVTPWGDYTCANVLYELTRPIFQFAAIIPHLEAWRDQMDTALRCVMDALPMQYRELASDNHNWSTPSISERQCRYYFDRHSSTLADHATLR